MANRNASNQKTRGTSFLWMMFFLLALCCFTSLAAACCSSKPSSRTYEADKVIAIQIGNTYSRVGFEDINGTVHIYSDIHGSPDIPSWVHYAGNQTLVGQAAKEAYLSKPENTIFDINLLLGKSKSELSAHDLWRWPFRVEDVRGRVAVRVDHGRYTHHVTPSDAMTDIIKYLKKVAESHLNEVVGHAVVSLPPYVNEDQREVIKQATKAAGLEPLRVVHDSVSTGIFHGLSQIPGEFNVLVYDIGGQGLDVTAILMDDGVFERVAQASNPRVGGNHFNGRIKNYLLQQVSQMDSKSSLDEEKTMGDLGFSDDASFRLDQEIEAAKRSLSTQPEARIELPSLQPRFGAMNHTISTEIFERLIADLLQESLSDVERVLENSGLTKEDLKTVILVGGSGHIPEVQRLLRTYFNNVDNILVEQPDQAVIRGLVNQAGLLSYSHYDCLCSVEVAYASLGIAASDGEVITFIPRWTVLPKEVTKIVTTTVDFQENLTVHVCEGEDIFAVGNRLIGQLDIHNITSAPAGVPKIALTLEVDGYASEIQVVARDVTSNDEGAPRWNTTFPLTRDWIEENEKKLHEASQLSEKESAALRRSDLLRHLHSLKREKRPSQSEDARGDVNPVSVSLLAIEQQLRDAWKELHPSGLQLYASQSSNAPLPTPWVDWDDDHSEL